MTSVAGLEISTFRVPLDTAGTMLISQQCGYFHLWRFLNSDGSLSLDGEIRATFGGQWDAEQIPFGYNSRVQLSVPVDRVLLGWNSQPGRIAEILMTRDPRGLEATNAPARQLVFQGQATAMRTDAVAIGTGNTLIAPADTRRQRIVIAAPVGNSGVVVIGPGITNLATSLPLEPGQSFVGFSSAQYNARSAATGNFLRILEELA
jgi:hypothetical protein